jgi:prolyl-tRNA synthetase
MRQSKLFTKTSKNAPADETAKNAELLIRAGFIHKEMAGVYSYLPLGLRVIKKIEDIIREEMNAIGGIEMKTSILQNKEVWEKSNRWDDAVVDNWFKTTLKNGGELGLSFTNEEAYFNILKKFVSSYKDLPVYPYDFKEIFRNEVRSKSGMMRGREFYWKAMYSFCRSEAEHLEFYEKAKQAYKNIFNRAGIGDKTYITFASGGVFSKYSHEFQTLCEAGEDTVYIDKADLGKGLSMPDNKSAYNQEVWTEEIKKEIPSVGDFEEHKAIEVGNIFTLGTKYTEPFDLRVKNETGEESLVFMGSYGIGLGRLMGTVVELMSDERGIVWPKEVAPFAVHLVRLGDKENVIEFADNIYADLRKARVEVLYDDRDLRAGEKFADSDLIGIPLRIVVSDKTVAEGKVEMKYRTESDSELMLPEKAIEKIQG